MKKQYILVISFLVMFSNTLIIAKYQDQKKRFESFVTGSNMHGLGSSTIPETQKEDSAGFIPDLISTIKLSTSDSSWTNVKSLLEMDSYVVLSSEAPLATIDRVIVHDEKIYILDNQPKIVCFDLKGKVAFAINNKGKGPGEYYTITDMVINADQGFLTVADQGMRKLIHYSARTGKFLNEEKLKVSPDAMAFFDNKYYFYNPYHYNYPDDKSMHYSLIEAKDGTQITGREFPHDPAIANYKYDDCFHQFSYNDDEVFFRKRFIDTVFAVTKNGVVPRYSFELPNPLPYAVVQQKPDALELATQSDYTSTIYNVFRIANILYCNFFGPKFIASSFYDLEKDETIYCGYHVSPQASKELPAISLIDGTYNSMFYALIPPMIIMEKLETDPEILPKDWLSINENSNPVLAFYKIVR